MSKTFANRSRPTQTTRPAQHRNAATTSNSMSQQMPPNGDRDSSPTRQTRGDGFTMFAPIERNRQKMQNIADKETRDYEARRKNNRPHFNYVGTVGGGEPHQPNRVPVLAQNQPKQTPQQKHRMYQEQKKQREEKQSEEMKRLQREKSEKNAEKEKQRELSQKEKQREINNAFLDKLEGKTGKHSGKSSSAAVPGTLATASASDPTSTASASSSGAECAEPSSGFEFSNTDQLNAEDFQDDLTEAMNQLQCRFPYVEPAVLEDLLQQTGNDVEGVAELLSL